MAKKKIGINGFGRIGRLTFRQLLASGEVDITAINDLTDTATLAHLLKYDSIHGRFDGSVEVDGTDLIVNGDRIRVTAERDPSELDWSDTAVVLEATGHFRTLEAATKHITAGARQVVISAPAKGGDVPTVVLGVNDHDLNEDAKVISNASCTTNCLAPMAKLIDDHFGIERGYMTTVHSYTGDQRIHDAPHRDLRRARAAALSIIPTTTGATSAVELVLPQLKGKLNGSALRVPTPTGSLTDLTFVIGKSATPQEINAVFKKASENEMKGILEYTEDPLVSADIISNPHSCVFDSLLTEVNGSLARIVGWYDNEAGYSARAAELCIRLS